MSAVGVDSEALAALAAALRLYPAVKADVRTRAAEGEWLALFDLDQTAEGWRTLEFLAWAAGDMAEGGAGVALRPVSPPPYLNAPGACLGFILSGEEATAPVGRVAAMLSEWRGDYVGVGEE